MKAYDVIIYLGINQSNLNKYFNLRNEIGKSFKTLLIIDCSRWGLSGNRLESSKQLLKLYESHFSHSDVLLCRGLEDAIHIISNTPHKLGIYSACSSRRKGFLMGSNADVKASKLKGAKTIQLSWTTGELAYKSNVYRGSDYVSLISKGICKLFNDDHLVVDRYNKFTKDKKIIFSNCFLYDPIENFMPFKISKELFYQKYSLDDKKPIFIYTPTSVPSFKNKQGGSFGLEAYERVIKDLPDIANILIKLHPSDLRLWKSDRIGNRYSFELINDYKKHIENVRLLLPSDTHWGYKYCDAVIACLSSVSWDLAQYKKPTIYLDTNSKGNITFNKSVWKNYVWPGMRCTESKYLRSFMENPSSYKLKKEIFEEFNNKYFIDEYSYVILANQVKKILGA